MFNIRSVESKAAEVYVNVNDLIIVFLIEIDECQTDPEKDMLRSLVARLTEIRDKGHKKDK